jgi:hypothetical protein
MLVIGYLYTLHKDWESKREAAWELVSPIQDPTTEIRKVSQFLRILCYLCIENRMLNESEEISNDAVSINEYLRKLSSRKE